MLPEVTAWRPAPHLHETPELLYAEEVHQTAALRLRKKLRDFGVRPERGDGRGRHDPASSGIIRGRGPGRAIGLRADMERAADP